MKKGSKVRVVDADDSRAGQIGTLINSFEGSDEVVGVRFVDGGEEESYAAYQLRPVGAWEWVRRAFFGR